MHKTRFETRCAVTRPGRELQLLDLAVLAGVQSVELESADAISGQLLDVSDHNADDSVSVRSAAVPVLVALDARPLFQAGQMTMVDVFCSQHIHQKSANGRKTGWKCRDVCAAYRRRPARRRGRDHLVQFLERNEKKKGQVKQKFE